MRILTTKTRRHNGILVFVACVALVGRAGAQAPRTVVLVCEGLTADDLHSAEMPRLRALALNGRAALMNVATGGGPADQSAWLALALGTVAPAETTDLDLFPADYGPVENANAALVFQRRTGIAVSPAPPAPVIHLGIAPLTRRRLNQGLVGAVAARAGRPEAIDAGGLGSYRSGLFAVDARGIGPPGDFAGPYAPLLDAVPRSSAQITVIDVRGGVDEKQRLEGFLPVDGKPADRILVLSPRSLARDRLSLAVLGGPGFSPGLLTSATTRTPGLVANIDAAPTLLSWLGIAIPASMTGHPFMETLGSLADLDELDRIVSLNERALDPVCYILAGVAVFALVGGLASIRLVPQAGPFFSFLILALMNMPIALLYSPAMLPPSVTLLAAISLSIMAALAAAEMLAARWLRWSPCRVVAALTSAAILIDALFGQSLVKFSLLSGYQVQGIRFYGIGNEYMGILIGMVLLFGFLGRWRHPGWIFAAVAFVIGFPRLGANAGGLIAAAVAFGCGAACLRGRSAGWRQALLWSVAGLAAAFGMAYADRALPGGYRAPSHLGGAVQAAGERGYGYLLEIVERKVAMNARIVRHPGVIAAMAAIGGLWWLAGGAMKRRFDAVRDHHMEWAQGLPAAGWGALAAFLFNDSGIVAALFILGPFITSGLYWLFSEPLIETNPQSAIRHPQSPLSTS